MTRHTLTCWCCLSPGKAYNAQVFDGEVVLSYIVICEDCGGLMKSHPAFVAAIIEALKTTYVIG